MVANITNWEALWQEEYKDSFAKFLWLSWLHLGHTPPTPIQIDMANFLQYGPQRTCIEALRGEGKSYVTCCFAAWRLRRDPSEAIIIVSCSKPKATDNANFIHDLIYSMPILKPLRLTAEDKCDPERNYRDSVLAFDVKGSRLQQVPSVWCSGIKGSVTGKRGSLIILDDIEDPQNAISIVQRERIEYLTTEFEAVIKTGSDTRIIYLGTPHSSASIYLKLPDKGYEVRIWPAEVPTPDWMEAFGRHLGPCIQQMLDNGVAPGTPTEPRFDEAELLKRKIAMGESRYTSQYLLDPRKNDANYFPFKLRNLIVMDVDPYRAPVQVVWSSDERCRLDLDVIGNKGDSCYTYMYADPRFEPYEHIIMAIDPSGKGEDQTAICVIGVLNGKLHVIHLEGIDGGFEPEVLEKIAKLSFKFRVSHIYTESNYGGGMFDDLLKPYLKKYEKFDWKCGITSEHNTKQKEQRICDILEPVISSHRLVMNKQVLLNDEEIKDFTPYYTFSYQFSQMTREKSAVTHDDKMDVLAMAVRFCQSYLATGEEEAVEDYNKSKEDEAWEQMLKHIPVVNQQPEQDPSTFINHKINMNHHSMFN